MNFDMVYFDTKIDKKMVEIIELQIKGELKLEHAYKKWTSWPGTRHIRN